MVRIVDYQATQPLNKFNLAKSFTIPFSPRRVQLAKLRLHLSRKASRVELIASVGVRGITGIAQIKFRIFRDGKEIFNTIQGIESTGSEQNYIVTFQAIDFDVKSGSHQYTLTAENLTKGTRADVVGPISFSALAIKKH